MGLGGTGGGDGEGGVVRSYENSATYKRRYGHLAKDNAASASESEEEEEEEEEVRSPHVS